MIIQSTPPKVYDLIEGTSHRTAGKFCLVLAVKPYYPAGAVEPTGWLVKSLNLSTNKYFNDWWSDMWLDWGVVTYDEHSV